MTSTTGQLRWSEPLHRASSLPEASAGRPGDRPWWVTVSALAAAVGLLLVVGLGVAARLAGAPSAEPVVTQDAWADDGVTPPPEELDDLRGLHGMTGFGAQAEGGMGGPVRWVRNLQDSGAGSLRAALAEGPGWVRFSPGLRGALRLDSPLEVPSATTVDGRGAEVRIEGHGLVLSRAQHVVLTFLVFDVRRAWADYLGNAAVLVQQQSSKVWVHKCTFVGGGAGVGGVGVLMTDQSRDATISWNRFVRWDKSILLGSDAVDEATAADRVTLHHNLFDRTQQRNPLVRFARVHSYNNWLRHWGGPGFGLGMQVTSRGELLSEGDIFDGRYERPALAAGEYDAPDVAAGNLAHEGSVFHDISSYLIEEHAANVVFDPPYRHTVDPPGEGLRRALEQGAGWHLTRED